jgi:hypothetical protein
VLKKTRQKQQLSIQMKKDVGIVFENVSRQSIHGITHFDTLQWLFVHIQLHTYFSFIYFAQSYFYTARIQTAILGT